MNGRKYTYCIFYLEKKYYRWIDRQLEKEGYRNIKAIIPTVQVLRRTIKGKMIYEPEPILFNYGFMRMPTKLAFDRPFLNLLKKKIPGIHHWLRDTETLHPRKKKHRIDNAEDFDDFSKVATISKKEVRRFQRISKQNKKFSLDDLVNLKPGDFVSLIGYPYDGIQAVVNDVNFKERKVRLGIEVLNGTLPLILPFDNVLYSVYKDYDADKLYAGPMDINPERLTNEAVDEFFNYKIY